MTEETTVKDTNRAGCRLDSELLRMARMIAAHEGRGISEVLERDLRGPLKRRYDRLVAEIGGEG